jgi:hypothetical protein
VLFGLNVKLQKAEERSESIGNSLVIGKLIFLSAKALIRI